MSEPLASCHASSRRPYVPPSQCGLCVPSIRLVTDGYFLTITEAEHEDGCPNHPRPITIHSHPATKGLRQPNAVTKPIEGNPLIHHKQTGKPTIVVTGTVHA